MSQHRKPQRVTAQEQPLGRHQCAPIGQASDDAARIAKLCEENVQSIVDLSDVLYPVGNDPFHAAQLRGIIQQHFARYYPGVASARQLAVHVSCGALTGYKLGILVDAKKLQAQYEAGGRPMASYFFQGNRITAEEAFRSSIVNFAAPLAEQVLAGGQLNASPGRFIAMGALATYGCEPTANIITKHKSRIVRALTMGANLIAHHGRPINALADILMSGEGECADKVEAILREDTYGNAASFSLFKRIKQATRLIQAEDEFFQQLFNGGALH